MVIDTSRYGLSQFHGHGISDIFRDLSRPIAFFIFHEFVVEGKALYERRLPDRDGPVLFRMAVASISESETQSGKSRRWLVPPHARVYAAAVRFPAFLFMAIRRQVRSRSHQIPPVLRDPLYPFPIQLAHLLRTVIRIFPILFSCVQEGKIADGFAYRHGPFVRRVDEFYGSKARSEQNEPFSFLRYAVSARVDYLVVRLVTVLFERFEKVGEGGIFFLVHQVRHVLHGDYLGLHVLDELGEFVQRTP